MGTTINKNLDSITYSGKILIKKFYKDKVIEEKSQRNHGYLPLFKFLCYCLQGNYTIADRIIPNKIKLFGKNSYLDSWKTEGHEDYEGMDIIEVLRDASLHSNFIYTNKYPTLTQTESQVSTSLHFSLNSKYLIGDGIYVIALYGASTTDELSPSAVVILLDDSKTELEPITFDDEQANNIVIDWTLQFDNE